MDNYSDESMIAMYKKSLHENEEHKKWLQEMLSTINDEHKHYFRLQYNVTKAHIKVIVAELSSYKNQDFFTKELELAWNNLSIAIDNLKKYLDYEVSKIKKQKQKEKKLKWYDWIPIIGLATIVYRDYKFLSNITMLIWFIYQLTIVGTAWIKFMLYE